MSVLQRYQERLRLETESVRANWKLEETIYPGDDPEPAIADRVGDSCIEVRICGLLRLRLFDLSLSKAVSIVDDLVRSAADQLREITG
jgi:hypothetical protein